MATKKQARTAAMAVFQEALSIEMEWNWITFDGVISFVHMISRDLIEEWDKVTL